MTLPAPPTLPPSNLPLVDPATGLVATPWYTFLTALLNTTIPQIESALEAIQTQEALSQRIDQSISFTSGLTITASAPAGSTTASIAISAHTRIYLDIAAVSVQAGTVSGAPLNATVYVYYDDAKRMGGAVTYMATTDPNMAATSNANPGRVFVGTVTTPAAAGSSPTSGGGASPPTQGGGGTKPGTQQA